MLADGPSSRSKDGWRGTPEEQGFLHDVQGAACERFTTVLAPGSNVYHYDHIHVDLMRRATAGASASRARSPATWSRRARARATAAANRRHRLDRAAPWRPRPAGSSYSSYDNDDRGLPDAVPGED